MEKCCDCKKTVWPWQQSNISCSPVHKDCHKKSVREFMKNYPEKTGAILREMNEFSKRTGQSTF